MIELARNALCINDADWGSERHNSAMNQFFGYLRKVLTKQQFAALEEYCLKATSDEMVFEAMRLVNMKER